MDEYVKQSIESRKNAIFAAYNVEGELLKKVEALFAEMEKLGTVEPQITIALLPHLGQYSRLNI